MNVKRPMTEPMPDDAVALDAAFRAVLSRATPVAVPGDFAARMQQRIEARESDSVIESWTQRVLLGVMGGGVLLYGAAPVAEAIGSALQPFVAGMPWAAAAGLSAAVAWGLDQWWSRRGGPHLA